MSGAMLRYESSLRCNGGNTIPKSNYFNIIWCLSWVFFKNHSLNIGSLYRNMIRGSRTTECGEQLYWGHSRSLMKWNFRTVSPKGQKEVCVGDLYQSALGTYWSRETLLALIAGKFRVHVHEWWQVTIAISG